jgi:hypothetical protein
MHYKSWKETNNFFTVVIEGERTQEPKGKWAEPEAHFNLKW